MQNSLPSALGSSGYRNPAANRLSHDREQRLSLNSKGRCILMLITRLIAFPLAEWFVYRHLSKPYKELQTYIQKGWLYAALLGIAYYLLLFAAANFPTIITARPKDMPMMVLILILTPLTYFTILLAQYQQMEVSRTKEQDWVLSTQKAQCVRSAVGC